MDYTNYQAAYLDKSHLLEIDGNHYFTSIDFMLLLRAVSVDADYAESLALILSTLLQELEGPKEQGLIELLEEALASSGDWYGTLYNMQLRSSNLGKIILDYSPGVAGPYSNPLPESNEVSPMDALFGAHRRLIFALQAIEKIMPKIQLFEGYDLPIPAGGSYTHYEPVVTGQRELREPDEHEFENYRAAVDSEDLPKIAQEMEAHRRHVSYFAQQLDEAKELSTQAPDTFPADAAGAYFATPELAQQWLEGNSLALARGIALEPRWNQENFIPLTARSLSELYRTVRVKPFMEHDIYSRALAEVLNAIDKSGTTEQVRRALARNIRR